MPKRFFKPPEHVIREWPEVFNDLYMNTMPVAYLNIVKFEFKDGRIWEIRIQDLLKKSSTSEVADRLIETVTEYRNEIQKIDFEVDIEKLKADIKNETKRFL